MAGFDKVLKAIKKGKSAKREAKDFSICMDKEMGAIIEELNGELMYWLPTHADLLADDWTIYRR